ncbi:MAG: penicillin-binding transpeptidase domain-containing protein [Candidatus Zapsychrus exili]|nr:penicillin-binding transpeptidase domain-containing protein [Candidatus Zapsychrus exili]
MQIRKYVLRFSLIFIFIITCLIAFSIKLVLIQIFKSSHLASLAEQQHNYLVDIEPIRGSIYDSKLRPLAFNVAVYSLFANPKSMKQSDKEQAVQYLSGFFNMDPDKIKTKLEKDKYFVWIKRKLSSDLVDKIKERKIRGLGFKRESKRFYPNGSLASHLIGFAGMDNNGLEGLELAYNNELKGEPGRMRVLRDAKRRELMTEDSFIPPKHGAHIVLTIDETIQYIAERALDKAMDRNNAKSASIIVINPKTGEILALVNRPTYNLKDINKSSVEDRTNRAISFVYEPGSVFKIVALSAALEEEMFSETDRIFCEDGKYRVANHTLHDSHPHGMLTFQEVFELSSNIGVTKVAQKLGARTIYKYGKRFRFGEKTGVDLGGEVAGVFKSPKVWSGTSIGAIPIGHEVTTTPLQLVCAIGAIANDGVYMRPFVVKGIMDSKEEIVKSFEPEVISRIISLNTAQRAKDILVGVVERGTAKKARIKGVSVGGKTGTAQKVINGTYSHNRYYSSFIGFAPAEDPQLAAIVVFDDPRPSYFGGTVAAPVFKEVIENILRYLKN